MLYVLGLYIPIMEAISKLDILPLIPFAAGLIPGIFIISKSMEILLENKKEETYLTVLGFLVGSLTELFIQTDFSALFESPSPLSFAPFLLMPAGFLAVYSLYGFKKQHPFKEGAIR